MSAATVELPDHDRRQRGLYLGTEAGDATDDATATHWWKRYRENGFFARGSGEWWCDHAAFRFRRFLTREPLAVPFAAIEGVDIGHSHAGRVLLCASAIKIRWRRHGLRLSSGFVVARDKAATTAVAEALRRFSGPAS